MAHSANQINEMRDKIAANPAMIAEAAARYQTAISDKYASHYVRSQVGSEISALNNVTVKDNPGVELGNLQAGKAVDKNLAPQIDKGGRSL